MTKEFDKRNAAKSRRVCEAMAEAASTGKRVLTERERQILDIWPRFENGEYVWFGDRYEDWDGLKKEVAAVQFERDERSLLDRDGFHTCFSFGERVKRPVQSVLDADGVEIKVGDTVWTLDGLEGVVTKVEDGAAYIAYESDYAQCEEAANLTHARPDSWERLEEDAAKSDCDYFGRDVSDCDRCPARKSTLSCGQSKSLDIIRRAKALAGVEVD